MKNYLITLILFTAATSLCNAQNITLFGMTESGGNQSDLGSIFKTNGTGTAFKSEFDFSYADVNPYGLLIQASNGLIYGTTNGGGAYSYGTLYSYNILDSIKTDLYDFGNGPDAREPVMVIQVNDSLLYGTANSGGEGTYGAIFKYNILTGKETIVYNFGGPPDGVGPGPLIQVNDSMLYGATNDGGIPFVNQGTLFSFNINSNKETILHSFNSGTTDGQKPGDALLLANNGLLYGTTDYGGTFDNGILFSYNILSDTLTNLHNFGNGNDDGQPGSLVQASNGLLYGACTSNIINNSGSLYSYNISSGIETVLHNFNGSDGVGPAGGKLQIVGDTLLYGEATDGGKYGYGNIFLFNINTAKCSSLYSFNYSSTDGNSPNGQLLKANNGLFYGITESGGKYRGGTLFNFNPNTSAEADLYNFARTNGGSPYGSLMKANDSLLYGMTSIGGSNDTGVIFSFNVSTQTETVVHDFGNGTDGKYPTGSLIQANNGLLYGMTVNGGAIKNSGTLFSYDIASKTEIDLYDFGGSNDGKNPHGSLIQANDGLLYGMTTNGGANRKGCIFSYNVLTGKETVLHDFGSGTDGEQPLYGSLMQASNGLLYGLTEVGAAGNGIIFSYNIVSGVERDVHDFDANIEGDGPCGSLIEASNGLLYGLTEIGNTNKGTIFSFDPSSGNEAVVHTFGNGTDGQLPFGSLIQASDGMLYGMTEWGGANMDGIVFSYNIFTGTEKDIHDFAYSDGETPYGNLIEYDTNKVFTYINLLAGINQSVSIFPNPSSGIFTVKINSNQKIYLAEVYDVMGQRVLQNNISPGNNNLNLSAEPAGAYFVKLKSEEGVITEKLMIVK